MKFIQLFCVISLPSLCLCLEEVFKWTSLKPGNKTLGTPTSLEVFQNRIFLTVPKWSDHDSHSLFYLNTTQEYQSPKLTPFPGSESIFSAIHLTKDFCERLWVLDSGANNISFQGTWRKTQKISPKLFVFHLNTNQLLFKYEIPSYLLSNDSFLVKIAMETTEDCSKSFAYIADTRPALIVYSMQKNQSWAVYDQKFEAGQFLFPFCLKEYPGVLYFQKFSINIEFLHLQTSNNTFKIEGQTLTQTSSCIIDSEDWIMVMGLLRQPAISCWNTIKPLTMKNENLIAEDNQTMIQVTDVKLEEKQVWLLTHNQKLFEQKETQIRILKGNLKDLIIDTSCELDYVEEMEETTTEEIMVRKPKNNGTKGRNIYILSYAIFLIYKIQ